MEILDATRIAPTKFDGVFTGYIAGRQSVWTRKALEYAEVPDQLEWSRMFSEAVGDRFSTSTVLIQNDFGLCMFQEWDPSACRISAAILGGLYNFPIKRGQSVCVLEASLPTLLHLCELVGPEGQVRAVGVANCDTRGLSLLMSRFANLDVEGSSLKRVLGCGFQKSDIDLIFSYLGTDTLIAIVPSADVAHYLETYVRPLVPIRSWFIFVLPGPPYKLESLLSLLGAHKEEQLGVGDGVVVVAKSDSICLETMLEPLSSLLNKIPTQPVIVSPVIPTDLEVQEAAANVIAAYQMGSISGPMSHRLCSMALAQLEKQSAVPSLEQLITELDKQVRQAEALNQ